MVFSKKWVQNHAKFLLHFLIHIDIHVAVCLNASNLMIGPKIVGPFLCIFWLLYFMHIVLPC